MVQEDLKTCPDSKILMCVSVDKSQLPTLSRATGQYRMLDTVLYSVPQQQNDNHAYTCKFPVPVWEDVYNIWGFQFRTEVATSAL